MSCWSDGVIPNEPLGAPLIGEVCSVSCSFTFQSMLQWWCGVRRPRCVSTHRGAFGWRLLAGRWCRKVLLPAVAWEIPALLE